MKSIFNKDCLFSVKTSNGCNKLSIVIMSPKAGVGISGASAEPVVDDVTKMNRYSAKRDLSCCVQALASVTRPLNSITSLSLGLSLSGLRPSSTNNRSNGCLFSSSTRSLRSGFKMTLPVFALALILTFGIISESRAEDTAPTSGFCNDEGTCLWNLDADGTMIISAAINHSTGKAYTNVVMNNYVCDDATGIGNRPWEDNMAKIKNLIIGDNIANIGRESFQSAINLEMVTGMKDVKKIGFDCFVRTPKLQSIETPAVEILENFALASNSPYLISIDLPNIKSLGVAAVGAHLRYIGLPGEDVYINNAFRENSFLHNCSNENRTACGSCGNDYVMSGLGCVSDCGAGYLGKEGRCIDAALGCGENYRQIETWCNRIRYTPAEAAQWLNEDNNTVILTFKK